MVNHHPRVNILNPGCGVGGHCIFVDLLFIVSQDPKNSNLIRMIRGVNNNKSDWIIGNIVEKNCQLSASLNRQPTIGILLGLAFNPNVDDIRVSPALKIYKECFGKGINLLACEPNIKFPKNITLFPLEEVLNKCDLIFTLVDHNEFKNIKSEKTIINY